jgi:hypothetical protein
MADMRYFVHSPRRCMLMADPSQLTNTSEQAPQSLSSLWQTLSGRSILDSLKLILAGAGLSDVLATVAR